MVKSTNKTIIRRKNFKLDVSGIDKCNKQEIADNMKRVNIIRWLKNIPLPETSVLLVDIHNSLSQVCEDNK